MLLSPPEMQEEQIIPWTAPIDMPALGSGALLLLLLLAWIFVKSIRKIAAVILTLCLAYLLLRLGGVDPIRCVIEHLPPSINPFGEGQ